MLRENQIAAIDISIKNDFSSGIHYHATIGKILDCYVYY